MRTRILLALTLLLALSACGDDPASPPAVQQHPTTPILDCGPGLGGGGGGPCVTTTTPPDSI